MSYLLFVYIIECVLVEFLSYYSGGKIYFVEDLIIF